MDFNIEKQNPTKKQVPANWWLDSCYRPVK